MSISHLTHSNSVVFAYTKDQLLAKFLPYPEIRSIAKFISLRSYAPKDALEPEHYIGVSTNNDYLIYLYDGGCLELELDIGGSRCIVMATIQYTDMQPKGYPSLSVDVLHTQADIRKHEVWRNSVLTELPIINISNSKYHEIVAALDLKPSTPC